MYDFSQLTPKKLLSAEVNKNYQGGGSIVLSANSNYFTKHQSNLTQPPIHQTGLISNF